MAGEGGLETGGDLVDDAGDQGQRVQQVGVAVACGAAAVPGR